MPQSTVGMATLVFVNNDIRYGFHISIAGKKSWVDLFTRYIDSTPLHAYQIYLSSGHSKQKPSCNPTDVIAARELLLLHQKYLCVHASLLYNPCGSVFGASDEEFDRKWNSTLKGLTAELDVAAGLGAGCVLHVGTCQDKAYGLTMINKTLVNVLTTVTIEAEKMAKALGLTVQQYIKRRRVILENASGEGTKIGSTLEEIATILNAIPIGLQDQVTVCIDTAHLCGAGKYDVGSPVSLDKFYNDFESLIGLNKLEVFHLNDSKVPMGSKKDRHEGLGKGYLFGDLRTSGDGKEGLLHFVTRARDAGIPMIGEPPKDCEGIDDWEYLHSFILPLYE